MKRNAGFNLLETLIASSMLAGAVVTIGTLSGRSISTLRIDQETEKAWELADMQMKIIDAAGVQSFQNLGRFSGSFQQDSKYSWEAEVEETEIDNLFSVEISIGWLSGQKPRQIRCQTRLYDPTNPEQQEAPIEE